MMSFRKFIESLQPTNPNYFRLPQVLALAKKFAQWKPDEAQLILADIREGNTRVYIVGGAADPSRNHEVRGDMDVLFDRHFDMSDEAIAVSNLQIYLVSDGKNLHGQTNSLDRSKPHIDITNQVVSALSS